MQQTKQAELFLRLRHDAGGICRSYGMSPKSRQSSAAQLPARPHAMPGSFFLRVDVTERVLAANLIT